MPILPFPARRLLLGVTGSITAAQAPALAVALRELCDLDVRAVMTPAAATFVTPKALAVTTRNPVVVDHVQGTHEPTVAHVTLTAWADLVMVLPATADFLAKAAHGLAPDVLSTCVLAAPCPVVFVPSMNPAMWRKAAVQRNVELLRQDGYGVVPPREGLSAADGTVGVGSVPPLPDLVAWVADWLGADQAAPSQGEHTHAA